MAINERSRLPNRPQRLSSLIHTISFALATGFTAAVVLGFVH